MPNVKGVVLTDRDRALLAYTGIARYVSADQVHQLIAPTHSKKLVYRRLAKLCLPGARPGEGACLRQLQYRRSEGTGVPVWALTAYGRSVVAPTLPWLPPPAAHDVGHRFLEHTLLLNDVLLGLVLALRTSETAPLGELPFRWLAESDEALAFRAMGRHLGERYEAVLKPDAILEIPGQKRRLFLEAETGTQSIVTSHPERTGAITAKLQRYRQYVCVPSDDLARTWYTNAFRDGFAPRLVFLVHSADRKERVSQAVTKALGRDQGLKVLVLTFGEAPSRLLSYFADRVAQLRAAKLSPAAAPVPAKASTAPSAPAGPVPRFILAVDERELRRLREALQCVDESLECAYDVILRHERATSCRFDVDRLPRDELQVLRNAILRYRPVEPAPPTTPARPGGT